MWLKKLRERETKGLIERETERKGKNNPLSLSEKYLQITYTKMRIFVKIFLHYV